MYTNRKHFAGLQAALDKGSFRMGGELSLTILGSQLIFLEFVRLIPTRGIT